MPGFGPGGAGSIPAKGVICKTRSWILEYKVLVTAQSSLENSLNTYAKQGWKVIYTHFDPLGIAPFQWKVILERETRTS